VNVGRWFGFSGYAVKTIQNNIDQIKFIGQAGSHLIVRKLTHTRNLHIERMLGIWVEDQNQ
jgi:hypothetical protein